MNLIQTYFGLDFTEKLLYGAAVVCTFAYLISLLLRLDKKNILREYAEAGTVAVWLALAIRFSFVEAYSIPSESMVPTLLVGDHLLVNKFIYGYHVPLSQGRVLSFRKPHRGEIVIFIPPINPLQSFVKRCVGLPGDILEVRNKVVYINGEARDYPQAIRKGITLSRGEPEPNIYSSGNADWMHSITIPAHTYWAGEGPDSIQMPKNATWNKDWYGPITVPAHTYWMMGDNRDSSFDSRFWGPVPEENLRGKPLVRYWPADRIGVPR